jgi:hypothetical protein
LAVAYKRLGEPYVFTHNLVLEQDDGVSRVKFSPEIAQLLRQYYRGEGCPMGRIKAGSGARGNALQQDWHKLIDYLVPANATVDLYYEPKDLPMQLQASQAT